MLGLLLLLGGNGLQRLGFGHAQVDIGGVVGEGVGEVVAVGEAADDLIGVLVVVIVAVWCLAVARLAVCLGPDVWVVHLRGDFVLEPVAEFVDDIDKGFGRGAAVIGRDFLEALD